MPQVKAITVNEITTHKNRIEHLVKKYDPVIESMEGAALHYVCNEMKIPFLQIRSISNYISDRDKHNWKLKESISNLNKTVLKYIDQLNKQH